MRIFQSGGYKINLKTNETEKSNFKYIFFVIVGSLGKVLNNGIRSVVKEIAWEIKRTIEKRTRLGRNLPRQVKKKNKSYKNASLVPRRA